MISVEVAGGRKGQTLILEQLRKDCRGKGEGLGV
jgi:hypothetical protein